MAMLQHRVVAAHTVVRMILVVHGSMQSNIKMWTFEEFQSLLVGKIVLILQQYVNQY